MARRRTFLVAGVVVLLAGLAAAAAVVLGEGRYDHALVRYDQEKGEPHRYVNLPDGQAQLAIGSPDSHRIVVQWRDPDGRGWTAPETVWQAGDGLTAIGSTVRYGGGTVAVRERFTADISDEYDGNNVIVGIVCRDLRCSARRVPTFATDPQVTPDGRTALLGEDERGPVLWTEGSGIRASRWQGRPSTDQDEGRLTSASLLAPDGSLRVVSDTASAGTCTFELFVSGSRRASLVHAASVTRAQRDRSQTLCGSYLDTISRDWVGVERADQPGMFWFVRRGGTWTTTQDDPSGKVVVDADGCCSTGIARFVHWNQVSSASRDGGRHFVMQTHLLGRETWERPVVVDGSPSGSVCDMPGRELTPIGRSGAFMVHVCRRVGTQMRPRGRSYLVIASADLRRWESRVVADDGSEPQVDGDTLSIGRTTWSPSAGFGTR